MATMDRVSKTAVEEYTIFVLRDLHPILNVSTAKKRGGSARIAEFNAGIEAQQKTIVLTSHTLELPERGYSKKKSQ